MKKARVYASSSQSFRPIPSTAAVFTVSTTTHAAGGGLRLEEIKAELISGRDLRKKGNRKRPPLLIKNHPDSDLQCTKLCA